MDIKALLETPHRSVHWAYLNRLRATAASTESPEALFAEWRRLISQDVAAKAPHVFAEAVDQVARLTLAGRISIIQTVQAFTDLIAPPNIQKRSALDPSLLSTVCDALVQLVVAGGDVLATQEADSARENIMRTALERDPSLFSPVLQHIYSSLLNLDSSTVIDSEIVFATKWENAGRLLKYAIVDPTVPPWAQSRTLSLLFDIVRELSVDSSDSVRGRAIVMLDWLVDIGLAVGQSLETQNAKTTPVYTQIDVQGRWDRVQLVEQCTRAVEVFCVHANLTQATQSGSCGAGSLDKLASIVDRLRLMTASLLFSRTYDMDYILQARSRSSGRDGGSLAFVLDRLSATSMTLSVCGADSVLNNLHAHDYPRVDILVWVLSAIQAASAKSTREQNCCLSVIDRILNSKSVFASIPVQVAHIARFPLLCVASSGFNQQICSTAIRICKDIDQKILPMGSEFTKDVTLACQAITDLAASAYVSGLLPLLFNALRNYLSVYATGSDIAVGSIDTISKQPFLLAPFLFAWNGHASSSDVRVAIAQVALADLLEMLPKHPNLRLDLLPLFMYLLRRPETPSAFQQILVRDGIPCLATTKDAFTTSRVVSVISQLWSRSKDLSTVTSPSSGLLTNAGNRDKDNGRLQLCCLAVRAWANIVFRNPRVWRDLRLVIIQFVESKKAAAAATLKVPNSCILNPEYEWTILMIIRDLVLYEAEKYADEVLPLIYALFTYARDSLSVSSTAILVDVLSTCVESHVAEAHSIWTAILSAQADFWLAKVGHIDSLDGKSSMAEQAAPVLNALARFFKMVATKGNGSGPNATFRYGILLHYVAPICGLSFSKETQDSPEDAPIPEEVSIVSADFFDILTLQTRNTFLSALSTFPIDDITLLTSGRSPTLLLHELLSSATYGRSLANSPRSTIRGSCLSDLFSVLMDKEVRFMRQSVFSGRNAVTRSFDDNDKQTIDVNASQSQKRIWAQSNFERSQSMNDALSPALRQAMEMYWSKDKHGGAVLVSGNALASMVSADGDGGRQNENLARSSFVNESDRVGFDAAVSSEQQKMVAELRSLIADIRLSDHWCLHNIAVDTWQMWFSSLLRRIQSLPLIESENGPDRITSETAANTGLPLVRSAGFKILSVLQSQLDSGGVPAHVSNAIYAIAGLVKAAWSVDQVIGSDLCAVANRSLAEHNILSIDQSADDFWSQKAFKHNRDILIAAIECVSATAICQGHDIPALSRLAEFLMSGLTQYSASGLSTLPSSVVYALGRSLLHLHTALSGQKTDTRTFSEETVVVEADDIRRCIERLDVLQPGVSATEQVSSKPMNVDIGSIGLAISLAAMHRHWISNLINPAMTEHSATPRAAQARRTIAITLDHAFTNLSNVGNEQWSPQSLASLYYLCFVWPPRPIVQRHVELHKDLFVVTPDRAWQTANRLVRRLRASAEQNDQIVESRDINFINHVEIAFSTLTYHMTMTASQSTAQTAHLRLVEQHSGWVRGETEAAAEKLAANEKSDLRVNSTVALAILLGVPMHGVAETTVSNEYLPKTQQKKLPVLLGIGSVQYGSTAWLRISKSLLHVSLASLLGCSGLSQHQASDGVELENDQLEPGHDAGGGIVEVDDARVAHVSSFVLGGLYAQSARAMHLLSLTNEASATAMPSGRHVKDDKHSSQLEQPNRVQQPASGNMDDLSGADDAAATAMDEEPKSLGHLPAPTSWCRAVWESINEFTRSMVDNDGAISSAVESRLATLLQSILRMERPFPVVDMRTIFVNVLGIYMRMLDAGDGKATRLPIVALMLEIARKLSSISYSASQFLMDCCCEVVGKAANIFGAETRSSSAYCANDIDPNSLVYLTLSCLGGPGLGRVLELSGFSLGKQESQGYRLDPAIGRLICADTRWAGEKLDLALQKTLPLLLRKGETGKNEMLAESDAERMFRLMSKVGIQESQAANMCTKLLSQVFSGDRTGSVVVAFQIRLLLTLEAHISQASAETRSGTAMRKATREKIIVAVARLFDENSIAKAADNASERESLLWNAAGVVYCGVDLAKGSELLARDAAKLSNAEYSQLIKLQSIVLQRWLSGQPGVYRDAKQLVDRDTANSAVSTWLKLVFREWGKRISIGHAKFQENAPVHSAQINTKTEQCLQTVALAKFSKSRSAGRGQSGVADACRLVIQGLDMAILAVSSRTPVSERNRNKGDACLSSNTSTIAASALAYWTLPLLTGHCAPPPPPSGSSAANDFTTCLPSAVLACGEVLEYVNLASRYIQAGPNPDSDAEISGQQQFSVQLRTRIQRLLELAPSPAVKRIFNGVLSNLAILGMLPPSDLSSIL
ncbi:hypothetical protein IW140_004858 [Coemansia sp. RSA 1813]|nr:hypothetical protein EV178_004904 [Coemansia sp. RSA 1646]KAJ1769495.1 hypothetical protein LPJ74_003981 [Coemansia sp. RSA 1843]KAJ2087490.1 hypothetical protein IW138_004950 [Coemansia sp. RSA 986]KAJ2216177.1 hypothetical protein EV179_001637 [Coemansia sp. RSA 487]KAJ2566670.1 hypothetical protein IW140_004858 [Coemansia sp. RSA 1813]